MDSVCLQKMAFHGFHGAHPEEKVLGQRFYVDLTVEGDFSAAGHSDNLADAVDYGPIYRAVREIMEGPSVNLLEHLGEKICQSVLALNPRILSVEGRDRQAVRASCRSFGRGQGDNPPSGIRSRQLI